MTNAVFLTAAAFILGGGAYQTIRQLSPPADTPMAWFPLGLACALRAPVIATLINTTAHVPNLNVLAGNSMTLISTYNLLILIVYCTEPASRRGRHKSRLRLGFLAVALSCMTGLFGWSLAAPPGDFLEHRNVQSLTYVLIYVSYLAAGMISAGRLCVRHVRHTPDWYLRLGLRLIVLGIALGILYCAVYAYHTVATHTQLAQLGPPIVTSTLLPSTACVLLIIGFTIDGWGPLLNEGRQRLVDYRSYRKLGPLWRALAEVAPEAIFLPDTAILTIGQKRYRRIIEIRDMILILRAYRDPTLATAMVAARESSRATAEATMIVHAIRARREGRLAAGDPDIAIPPQLEADLATESHRFEAKLAKESHWLEEVSAALTTVVHSPYDTKDRGVHFPRPHGGFKDV